MKKSQRLILILLLGLLPMAFVHADDDDDDDGGRFFSFFKHRNGVEVVSDPVYEANCADCHFLYQPGLLPARSWRELLTPARLENHFGENAELDEADRKSILAFLERHSADGSDYRLSIKVRRSIRPGETPLKISEVPYIREKHHELGRRHFEDNPGVRFRGNCSACHRRAKQGDYNEDSVRIPNFPNWDD